MFSHCTFTEAEKGTAKRRKEIDAEAKKEAAKRRKEIDAEAEKEAEGDRFERTMRGVLARVGTYSI